MMLIFECGNKNVDLATRRSSVWLRDVLKIKSNEPLESGTSGISVALEYPVVQVNSQG